MPLWLDLLRTPMAAPETATLKRMRLVWQSLCFSTAAGAAFFGPIHRAVGRGASGGMAIRSIASSMLKPSAMSASIAAKVLGLEEKRVAE